MAEIDKDSSAIDRPKIKELYAFIKKNIISEDDIIDTVARAPSVDEAITILTAQADSISEEKHNASAQERVVHETETPPSHDVVTVHSELVFFGQDRDAFIASLPVGIRERANGRLERLQLDHMGDAKNISSYTGSGVLFEVRFMGGDRYRIYAGKFENRYHILGAGSKDSQSRDIAKFRSLFTEITS